MYKAITSFWSKSPNKTQSSSSSESQVDEDSWVFVSNTETLTIKNNNVMTNSWIASPPLVKTDESSSTNVHHFNPIENLLIEHASMSVYEQIASKTRNRCQKNITDNKLDEQTEEEGDDDDDDDDKTSMNQYPNLTSIHHRTMNLSSNSSVSALESSTSSSLVAHHRHLNRLHQRRKRSNKSSSKLILANNIDEPKQVLNKSLERQRLNHSRVLHQSSSRSNH